MAVGARATGELIAAASGSFGLIVSHSLDVHRELVVVSRAQAMSVAFYPPLGMVLFGSEVRSRGCRIASLSFCLIVWLIGRLVDWLMG